MDAPQLTSLIDIPRRDLPMIWDADFMLGPPDADGADSYVLGEIKVSSVFPSPSSAYFNATTAAAAKTHSVVIDRKCMILRSRGKTSSAGARSINSWIKQM